MIELPPPPPVDVIEHQVIKRWCPHCETWHSPKLNLSGQVIGQGRIGVRIASLVSYLRTTLRLPFRGIQRYLATLHSLQLSGGELVGIDAHRAAATTAPGRPTQDRGPAQHGSAWR